MQKHISRTIHWLTRKAGFQLIRTRPRPRELAWQKQIGGVSLPPTHSNFAIVVTEAGGFDGPGKGVPSQYFPIFCYTLRLAGFLPSFHANRDTLARSLPSLAQKPLAVLFLFNEENEPTVNDALASSSLVSERVPGAALINNPSVAGIIADKAASNKFFRSRSIPMPEMQTGTARLSTFSNTRKGSHDPVLKAEAGDPLDPARYNTEFIDTVRPYQGEPYYTSVRALCVGGTVISAYVRMRPISDADPSVHAIDTPLDPDLIEFFQSEIVNKRIKDIRSLCAKVGAHLGLGLYAHDIVVDQQDRLLLVEAGYKYSDWSWTTHLYPISAHLPSQIDHFTNAIARKAAEALVASLPVPPP